MSEMKKLCVMDSRIWTFWDQGVGGGEGGGGGYQRVQVSWVL